MASNDRNSQERCILTTTTNMPHTALLAFNKRISNDSLNTIIRRREKFQLRNAKYLHNKQNKQRNINVTNNDSHITRSHQNAAYLQKLLKDRHKCWLVFIMDFMLPCNIETGKALGSKHSRNKRCLLMLSTVWTVKELIDRTCLVKLHSESCNRFGSEL